MLRIRIAKELLLAVAISLICHLLYFVVIKFDFPSISNRFREPNISFLGELLDKSDFPSLIEGELGKSAAFDLKEIVFSAGQAKNHGILYNRVRLVSLEKQ
ncbi:MAG TPA: hypothetical protein ENH41_03905, partial [Candidatus Omnitrophica bacterium]|nr:hypothetical protein [Candidatus Omnitrophota bacterium]